MKIVKEKIHEEYLGSFKSPYRSLQIEVYKDPPGKAVLKNMDPWARAVTFPTGHFYIADNPNMTHGDLIKFLIRNGEIPPDNGREDAFAYWDRDKKMYYTVVAWQRRGDSNEFYLAESYSEDIVHKKYVMTRLIDWSDVAIEQYAGVLDFMYKTIYENPY